MQAPSQPEIISDTSWTTSREFSWLGWGLCHPHVPNWDWDGFCSFPVSQAGIEMGFVPFLLYLLGKLEKIKSSELGKLLSRSEASIKAVFLLFQVGFSWLFLDLENFGEREDLG